MLARVEACGVSARGAAVLLDKDGDAVELDDDGNAVNPDQLVAIERAG